ncbi:hypothetical protein BHE74_00025909 [Ensete ventricosum]|nr:hypothetical protein BHE74_00025909 [Ensete ventricosum]
MTWCMTFADGDKKNRCTTPRASFTPPSQYVVFFVPAPHPTMNHLLSLVASYGCFLIWFAVGYVFVSPSECGADASAFACLDLFLLVGLGTALVTLSALLRGADDRHGAPREPPWWAFLRPLQLGVASLPCD